MGRLQNQNQNQNQNSLLMTRQIDNFSPGAVIIEFLGETRIIKIITIIIIIRAGTSLASSWFSFS